ncbi:hypothetical protein HPB50_022462 [Hyalomma asiaticum]|uniref:Uncharacterized protein n=1 Tax=Hyalomma asiaticum TaxID=266040 RepID=A0ACB7TSZ6_HYAAI|nr:hypothetical protein HPB50_022462 [Hyalomma asiaticum]
MFLKYEEAKRYAFERTKTMAIVGEMAANAEKPLMDALKWQVFSVIVDGSHNGDVQLYPIVATYFVKETSRVENRLLYLGTVQAVAAAALSTSVNSAIVPVLSSPPAKFSMHMLCGSALTKRSNVLQDVQLITKFLPALMSLMVDDQNILPADDVASVSVLKERGFREATLTNTAILVDVPVQPKPLDYPNTDLSSSDLRRSALCDTVPHTHFKTCARCATLECEILATTLPKKPVRSLSSRLPQDDRESAITTIEHSGPPPDAYQAYVQENAVASVLALYYTFHTARQRDRTGVMRVLGSLAGAEGQRAYQDPFLHTLVGHLALMADDFAQEDFCTVVFDEFFLSGLSSNASGGGTPAALPTTEA